MRSRQSLGSRIGTSLAAGWVSMLIAGWPSRVAATDPMRTVVVVNANSVDSLTIANHYVGLRSIPDFGLVTLEGVPTGTACSFADFRQSILQPLLDELNARGLASQTDTVAYSAGFPTAIDFSAETKKFDPWRKAFTPTGSLNGLTTLYSLLGTEELLFAAPRANFYARPPSSVFDINPFLGADNATWEMAMTEAAAGEFAPAIATAERLLAKHPMQWPLAFRRAEWFARSERPDEAIRELRKLSKAGLLDRAMLQDGSAFAVLRRHAEYPQLVDSCVESIVERMPPVPFSARLTFGVNGLPVAEGTGIRFLLSTCLAVTHPQRGNTVAEAIESLRRAAAADGTGGPAEFYFSISSDVRAQTRKPLVPAATLLLRDLGHKVLIDQETLPEGREALMGAMLGTPNYDWAGKRNKILPGGIVENLTSTSGVLHEANSQTAMTELIRAGAAGTSGTVYEPFALQFKFPTPLLHVYYASGCTLAEAYHLAVESPYQLLIIGDPLCRPYGDDQNEAFSLTSVDDEASTTIECRFWRGQQGMSRIRQLDLFLDGKLVRSLPPTVQRIRIGHEDLAPGHHEARVFAVSKHPLAMRTGQAITFSVGRRAAAGQRAASGELGRLPVADVSIGSTLVDGRSVPATTVSVRAPDAQQVAVRHLGRRLRTADGPAARFEIPFSRTGLGPVRLIPEALVGDVWVRGEPVMIEIERPGNAGVDVIR